PQVMSAVLSWIQTICSTNRQRLFRQWSRGILAARLLRFYIRLWKIRKLTWHDTILKKGYATVIFIIIICIFVTAKLMYSILTIVPSDIAPMILPFPGGI